MNNIMNNTEKNINKPIIFDKSKFPDIYVTINSMKNDYEYNLFLNQWDNLYQEYNQEFNLFIETKNLSINNISLFHSYKIPSFIKNIKNNKPKLLKKTIINIYNKNILNIFKMIFSIQKPIAYVYIILFTHDNLNNKTYIFKP